MTSVIVLLLALVALGLGSVRWGRGAYLGMVIVILVYLAYAYLHG